MTPDVTWEEYDELRRLRAEVAEYRSAITWDTTCLNCSSLLDQNYLAYVRAEQAEAAVKAFEPTALSALLFNARELLDMYGDTVFHMTDRKDPWVYRTRDDIDAYRAKRGWSPHGYGGEE